MAPEKAAIPTKSQKIVNAEIVEGSDSLNIGTDPGVNLKTYSNNHETAVDTVGLDDTEKVSFEHRAKKG